MNGEVEFAQELVERFTSYHRYARTHAEGESVERASVFVS
jgi:hypothetical protein